MPDVKPVTAQPYPAAPTTFTFTAGTTQLTLTALESFEGRTPRRNVSHEFLKRDGGRVEDMARGQRTLQVRLQFIGKTCADDFSAFEAAVMANPTGLLTHPVVGQWTAFCQGPDYNVDFNRAINQIECNVLFVESELDSVVKADTPDVATAAQNTTGQQATQQTSTATFMGQLAASQATIGAALDSVQAGIAKVASGISAPVDYIFTIATAAQGVQATAIAALNTIKSYSDTLFSDVTSFVTAATDVFNGADPTGQSNSIAALLGVVQTDVGNLIASMTAASPTPAACADAVADVAIVMSYCYTLSDAVAAALPPTVKYTVPFDCNLIQLAAYLLEQANVQGDAIALASAIMGLSHIANPAAIPAGTVLPIPSLT